MLIIIISALIFIAQTANYFIRYKRREPQLIQAVDIVILVGISAGISFIGFTIEMLSRDIFSGIILILAYLILIGFILYLRYFTYSFFLQHIPVNEFIEASKNIFKKNNLDYQEFSGGFYLIKNNLTINYNKDVENQKSDTLVKFKKGVNRRQIYNLVVNNLELYICEKKFASKFHIWRQTITFTLIIMALGFGAFYWVFPSFQYRWSLLIMNPTQFKQYLNDAKALECQKIGGLFYKDKVVLHYYEEGGTYRCDKPYPDAGKICDDSYDCQSELCLANMSPNEEAFVRSGKALKKEGYCYAYNHHLETHGYQVVEGIVLYW